MTSYYSGLRDEFDRARARYYEKGGSEAVKKMKKIHFDQKKEEFTEARKVANQLLKKHKAEQARVTRADKERMGRRDGEGVGVY